MTASIQELTTTEEVREAFPVMQELRPHLTPESYEGMLAIMRPAGYRLFAVKSRDQVLALAGVAFLTNFYLGHHLWVYELVTTAAERSSGYGRALLEHLERLARAEGCDTIALSSGLKRFAAHRFYEDKVDFQKVGFEFTKPLKGKPFMAPPDPSRDEAGPAHST